MYNSDRQALLRYPFCHNLRSPRAQPNLQQSPIQYLVGLLGNPGLPRRARSCRNRRICNRVRCDNRRLRPKHDPNLLRLSQKSRTVGGVTKFVGGRGGIAAVGGVESNVVQVLANDARKAPNADVNCRRSRFFGLRNAANVAVVFI